MTDDGRLIPEPEMDLIPPEAVPATSEIVSAEAAAGWSADAPLFAPGSASGSAWVRLRRDWLGMAGLVVVVLMFAVAAMAPWLAPHDPAQQFADGLTAEALPVGPSSKFPLGTDALGRDLLSRMLYGARVSLLVGVLATGWAVALGVAVALAAGYSRSWRETLVMRATDLVMALPFYLMAVALVSVLKPSMWVLVLVIGLVYWTPMTRVIHGEVLRIRESEFVDAARAIGCSDLRILFRHILPHLAATIVVYTSLGVATTILFEAALSYIGLGVQPPTPSWGQMISEGQPYYLVAPHLVLYPGLAILVTVLAFYLLGDGLRGALDPQQRMLR